jgi:hypothetical protein
MTFLRNRLMQLNSSVNIEYGFDQGLAGDIEDYSKLLNEYRSQLEELVGYHLDSPNAFPNDSFAKYHVPFFERSIRRYHLSKQYA